MSIKVGDKFIIEIGTIAELPDGKKKYFIKPFESLVFDKTGLAKLEPIEKAWENELEKAKLVAYNDGFEHGKLWATEEYTKNRQGYYDNGYNNALDDVNHAIDVLKGMTVTECAEWFESCDEIGDVVCEITIQGIIRRIKAYEEKKKAEEESIKVGDEVLYGSSKLLVTKITNASICTVNADGKVDTWKATAELIKTGRHFDEVEQLLDKLKGE